MLLPPGLRDGLTAFFAVRCCQVSLKINALVSNAAKGRRKIAIRCVFDVVRFNV